MDIVGKLEEIIAELKGSVEEGAVVSPGTDPPWTEVLNTVDWLAFVREVRTGDLVHWPDFCAIVSGALVKLDLSASLSLETTIQGIGLWFHECALNDDLHEGIDWGAWLEALEAYLVKEDAEPDEYQGTTVIEFCEALAATMGDIPGLHTWESEHFSGIQLPPNMRKVFWFIKMVLFRFPEWHGEGLRAGEQSPMEWPDGSGTGWSHPGT